VSGPENLTKTSLPQGVELAYILFGADFIYVISKVSAAGTHVKTLDEASPFQALNFHLQWTIPGSRGDTQGFSG
jgi:hypothetical protein